MTHESTSLFIGGRWVAPSSGEVNTVIRAATEEPLGTTPLGGAEDIDRAVHAARSTTWSQVPAGERADIMEAFAKAIEARTDELARLVSAENGMPIKTSMPANVLFPTAVLRYYAALAPQTPWEEDRFGPGGVTRVLREPVGVVGAIVPWNYPQILAMMKIAPALAAGCTLVLKPALETALDANILAEAAIEAGLPAGVLNIVPGGMEAGQALVAHQGVDKIAFTGSTTAGRAIAASCGERLRPVTLELGGKSAAIILDDADIAATAAALADVSFPNNGMTCFSCTRVLAPAHRYAETLDAITEMASSLRVGDPLDPATDIGPLVSARHRERVERYISLGREEGARLTVGGDRPAHLDRGWYLQPTVFGDVDNGMTIAQEEIFGPVVCVIPYENEEHAVALANDSSYGLAGTVWTSDPQRGAAVANRIDTGTIGVNGYRMDITSPYGGNKASGLGRELGPEGLDAYVQMKSVYLPA
ncbi:aldehyde dehydrogenase [Streptomyces sp. NPDC093544]|uniref:aldehyde dehydrogenase n=1 Tax=Streptomyces sp. NPDC093544 TaxID=3155200 RepID=UPI0034283696